MYVMDFLVMFQLIQQPKWEVTNSVNSRVVIELPCFVTLISLDIYFSVLPLFLTRSILI
jgi:hypothetical protein